MKYLFLLILICIFSSCSSVENTKPVHKDSLQLDKITKDTLSNNLNQECLFDTSSYKLTTDILKAFNSKCSFTWDNETKAATTVFNNNDTLQLHVGGCDHFSYSAIYTIANSLLPNDSLQIEKAQWLAKTFFRDGFDEKFVTAIASKSYQLEKNELWILSLTIITKDTSITDHIYEPIQFETIGPRIKISLLAYQN